MENKKEKLWPAVFPDDYKGSVADWCLWLINNGYMKDGEWYGDVMLNSDTYDQLLEDCEK